MQVNRKEMLEAVTAVKKFTTQNSIPACARILIDGAGQKVVATDLTSRAEYAVQMTDYKRSVTVKPAPMPVIGEHFGKRLLDMKAVDLKALCDSDLFKEHGSVTAATTKQDRKDAIFGLCLADYDLYKATMVATGYVQEEPTANEIDELFLVDAELLWKILKADDQDFITLTAEEYIAPVEIGGYPVGYELRVGNYFKNIPLDRAEDFPGYEYPEALSDAVRVPGTELAWVSVPSMSAADDLRAHIVGIFFDQKNGRIVSTDGSRLHLLSRAISSEVNLLIDRKAVSKVAAIAKDKDVAVMVSKSGDEAALTHGCLTVYTENSRSDYPDFEELLVPAKSDIGIDSKLLRSACEQVGVMTACGQFKFGGAISVGGRAEYNGDCNRYDIPIAAGTVDPDINVALNVNFITDAIKPMGKTVAMGLTGEELAFSFSGNGMKALVMPMRLQ